MTINVLVGETRTGRITATIPVTGNRWTDVLNGWGSIDGVTCTSDVVREFDLRQKTHGVRSFLAIERDGRIKQAGPIWSRVWNWKDATLTLGAAGIGSIADRRIIYNGDEPVVTYANRSLGGIAVSLVADMLAQIPPFTNLPIVLPTVEAGDNTESFRRWELSRYGEQLRQLTQRAVDAPDIRFLPRRRADDPRYLEWVMQVGTENQPSLFQGGPDWVFDASAPQSPVRGISTDEDATQMAQMTWVTGNGMEEDMKLATAASTELINLGWPLTEIDEPRPTVSEYGTLLGHADNLLARSSRPVEVFKVQVSADAAAEVLPGDYARIVTKDDDWLGDMDRTMRIKSITGDLSDTVTLDMFPLAGLL